MIDRRRECRAAQRGIDQRGCRPGRNRRGGRNDRARLAARQPRRDRLHDRDAAAISRQRYKRLRPNRHQPTVAGVTPQPRQRLAAAAPPNRPPPALSPAPRRHRAARHRRARLRRTGDHRSRSRSPPRRPHRRRQPPAELATHLIPCRRPRRCRHPNPPRLPRHRPASPRHGAECSGAAATVRDRACRAGSAQLGVAAFRRGNAALIVFDQPLSIDTVAAARRSDVRRRIRADAANRDRDPPAAGLDDGAVAVAHPRRVAHRRRAARAGAAADPGHRRRRSPRPARRRSQARWSAWWIPTPAPTLLVGTQRRNGQGVPATAPFGGVHSAADLAGRGGGAERRHRGTAPNAAGLRAWPALSPCRRQSDIADQLARSAGLTRHFDFPSQPTEAAAELLQRQVTEAAAAAPLARGPPRQAVARTMIALGLGAEAGAMLNMAATDDPREAGSPDNAWRWRRLPPCWRIAR